MVREEGRSVQDGHFGDFADFHVDCPGSEGRRKWILEEAHIEEPRDNENGDHGNDSEEDSKRIHRKGNNEAERVELESFPAIQSEVGIGLVWPIVFAERKKSGKVKLG